MAGPALTHQLGVRHRHLPAPLGRIARGTRRATPGRLPRYQGYRACGTQAQEVEIGGLMDTIVRYRTPIRIALIFMAISLGVVAAWILIAPKGFYDHFPRRGRALGLGAAALQRAPGARLRRHRARAGACSRRSPRSGWSGGLVQATAIVLFVAGGLPHLAYHLTTTEHYSSRRQHRRPRPPGAPGVPAPAGALPGHSPRDDYAGLRPTKGDVMTGKADFTEEEWEQVLEGPTSAGLIVAASERGGTFQRLLDREGLQRGAPGPAEPLLDEAVSSKPEGRQGRARTPPRSGRSTGLQNLREALAWSSRRRPGGGRGLQGLHRRPRRAGRRGAQGRERGQRGGDGLEIAQTLGVEPAPAS